MSIEWTAEALTCACNEAEVRCYAISRQAMLAALNAAAAAQGLPEMTAIHTDDKKVWCLTDGGWKEDLRAPTPQPLVEWRWVSMGAFVEAAKKMKAAAERYVTARAAMAAAKEYEEAEDVFATAVAALAKEGGA
jgi:hypothetical protein